MPTSFVSTVFVVMTAFNNAGQLAPVDKSELPSPYTGPLFWSVQQCMYVRGKMTHPEKYVCQEFHGPAQTNWVYQPSGGNAGDPVAPAPTAPGSAPDSLGHSFNDVQVGPSKLAEKDAPTTEPLLAPTPPQVKTARRVAPRRQQRQEFDPIGAIASLFTPRGDW